MAEIFENVIGHDLAKEMFKRYLIKKIPHSFIFTGPKGLGKRKFAMEAVGVILCQSHNLCGKCMGCQDWKKTESQGFKLFPRGKIITIDEVRELKAELSRSDWRGNSRVVLVEDVEMITLPAANAILKVLEEPGSQIFFIFLAENINRVLDTIVSRSVVLPFHRLSRQEIDEFMIELGVEEKTSLAKIAMGLPARLEKVKLVSRERHLKNVKNFWLLLQAESWQKMDFATQVAESDRKRLMGLFFFWESCLRDLLLWQSGLNQYMWWQDEEISQLFQDFESLDVAGKLAKLSTMRKKIDVMSKKIQIFNWLISFN